MKRFAFAILCTLILSISASAQTLPYGRGGAYIAHALVIQTDATGAAVLNNYRQVVQATPLVSLNPARFAQLQSASTHDADPVAVYLLDDVSGAVVFQTIVSAPNAIRGEFHHDLDHPMAMGTNYTNIDRADAPLTKRTFPVRLPVIAGASRVSVQPMYGARSVSFFDLNNLSVTGTRGSDLDPVHDIAPVAQDIAGYSRGPVDNRVDVLIMGDGYTQAQQNKFASDAKVFVDGMFSINPYKAYKPLFNIVGVYAPSKQSGADRPPFDYACNDFDDSDGISCCRDNDPTWAAQTRSTRYNSSFCVNQTARLLVPMDMAKIYSDADAAYADWDEIWVIVNDTTYGGSGGMIATASVHPLGVEIQQHEVGHSLMRLADEYESAYGSFACFDNNDNDLDNCPPNVTNVSNRNNLKWKYWVSDTTPIPTNGPLPDSGAAGLWKGAYYSTSMYRGCYSCIMRYLGTPFGTVAAEQLPIILYKGGWQGHNTYYGELDGINLIDSAMPDAAFPIEIAAGATQTFTVNVTGPRNKIEVVWLLNGVPVQTVKTKPGAVSYTLTPREALSGVMLTAQVTDTNPILHPQNRHLSVATATWTINAAGAPNLPVELLANGGFEDADPLNAKRALNWTHNPNLKGARKCDNGLAASGACYYQLQGKPTGVGALKQTLSGATYADAGDLLVLGGAFKSTNLTGTFAVVAKVVWSDGTKSKFVLPALANTSANYVNVESLLQIAPTELRIVSKINVAMQFKTVGGKVLVDNLSLRNFANFVMP